MAQTRSRLIRLDDLTADLLWPRLLRTPELALRPSRWALGLLTAGALWAVGGVFDLVRGPAGEAGPLFAGLMDTEAAALREMAHALVRLDFGGVVGALVNAAAAFGALFEADGGSMTVLLALLAPVWAVGGGAIARSAGEEVALDRATPMGEAAGRALRRWRDLSLTLLGPMFLFLAAALAYWLYGLVLLRPPVLDLLGGLLYAPALLGGVMLALLAAALALGKWLLVPAAACEPEDWFEAVTRTIAFTLAAPLRLLLYMLVLTATLLVSFAALRLVFGFGAELAAAMAGAGGGWTPATLDAGAGPVEGTRGASAWLAGVWVGLLRALLAGYVVSFVFTGGATLYLSMRKLVDGQAFDDLWEDAGPPENDGPGTLD